MGSQAFAASVFRACKDRPGSQRRRHDNGGRGNCKVDRRSVVPRVRSGENPDLTTETIKAAATTRPSVETADMPVDVSVVIPCLNEANSIGICVGKALDAFKSAGLRGEVVVADNGSTDGSIDISEKLGARVVSVPA